MLSCEKIIDLASKQLDTSILKRQRIEMTLHLWLCKTCHRYVKQLGIIQTLAGNIDEHGKNIGLSSEARQRIQKILKKPK
ncbi:MAG: hypothetical protein Q9M50_13795 [Methylococcales bacterium]|nr:hypothetical protein [Methylococcales bacterium]